MFLTKLFALLRENNLTADLGGPIVMAQIENEYGLFGHDKEYLAHLRDFWRAGLGPGVVIHSTDPPNALDGSRLEGVLQTVDFGYTGDPKNYFAALKASQAQVSAEPQPLMCSEIYPGTLNYWGDDTFPVIYDPNAVAASVDKILDMERCGGSTSFALWLFTACTDFGFWGGVLFLGKWNALVPTYDFGAPVDEAGVVRPLFYILQDVLRKHGAVIPPGPGTGLPPPPPVTAYGKVTMSDSISLWDALPALLSTQKLAPNGTAIASPTVRTMEEIGQGLGYILYSAAIPAWLRTQNPSIVMAGMRDRAEVYLDRTLHQVCGRGATVDDESCTAGVPAQTAQPQRLDILVENFGRVTGGFEDSQTFRGIGRWVSMNGQEMSQWAIAPLPLDNLDSALGMNASSPVVAKWSAANATQTPSFFRGRFSIAQGQGLADTFLTLVGWQKGQAFVNGHNLARYWGARGPQVSFYCPAAWLNEGVNEVILFETGGAPASLTVEFRSTHIKVGAAASHDWEPCPRGFQTHQRGYWGNPMPPSGDTVNITVALCSAKCTKTAGCLAFELYELNGVMQQCYIFIDELKLPFVSDVNAGVTCRVEQ